jgi:hypothetical protein
VLLQPQFNRQFGTRRNIWKVTLKRVLKYGGEGVGQNHFVQDRAQWHTFLNTAIKLLIPYFIQWLFQPIQGPSLLFSSAIIFHRR